MYTKYKGMTGNGKLSRKLLAILVTSAMMSSVAFANEVILTTDGEDNDIVINQVGSSNVVNGGGLNSPAYIGGNGNTVQIDQIGVGNTLSLSINDTAGSGKGTGTAVTVYTDGSSNEQVIRCGTSLSASCNASVITTTISGDSNKTSQLLDSTGKNTSIINITGSNNEVKHNTSGSVVATGNITVNGVGGVGAGTGNYVELNQTGIGPRSATIVQSGNNNSIVVNQHTTTP